MADKAYTLEFRGAAEMVAKLKAAKGYINLKRMGDEMGAYMQGDIRKNRMAHQSGAPIPGKVTARHGGAGLSGAVQFRTQASGHNMTTRVGVSEDSVAAKYANIQEHGGIIAAIPGRWLTFQTYDKSWHRVKSVQLPPRPYIRPAFAENGPACAVICDRSIGRAFKSAGLT